MSEPIKVGDMVIVVRGRWCCGHETGREGNIFTVSKIAMAPFQEWCRFCGKPDIEPGALGHPIAMAIDVSSLKRIPPLSELEGLESEETDKLPTKRLIEAAARYKRLVTSK